jgi:predicted CoA-substrate-specific enzyme activase
MPPRRIEISLDIGSVAVKAVAFDGNGRLLERRHAPMCGRLQDAVREMLLSFAASAGDLPVALRAITGSNAAPFAEAFGLTPVDALVACYRGSTHLDPEAGAILEIGGEHAAFLLLERGGLRPRPLRDFRLNSVCSAGTGAFLEQEAHRLRLSIAEFARLAAAAAADLDLAGRCAVFAKTDAVHLQQNGVTVPEIAGAFCRMAARSVAAELVASAHYDPPLLFVGGVASNAGVVRSLRACLSLEDRALRVPEDHRYANAIGAYRHAAEDAAMRSRPLGDALRDMEGRPPRVPPAGGFRQSLGGRASSGGHDPTRESVAATAEDPREARNLGIDIGSTSVNVACVTRRGRVIGTRSVPTRGRPVAAIFELLGPMRECFPGDMPSAVGITGSGRQFIAAVLGADLAVNEITAHAAAATHVWPETDTVIDIGGQDAKFIRLENRRVTEFEMNKVCSAGTGSFLEEMAELLGLRIIDAFAAEAMRSTSPAELGERCTVFVSSELRRRQQQGFSREDLAAGLAYAVARNYVSRVIGRHTVGRRVSFQGGVAGNPAVHRALETILDRDIRVHPHHEAAGAIGAALLAGPEGAGGTRFRGFAGLDVDSVQSSVFRCDACSNRCTITSTATRAGARFYAGGLCDRHESGTVRSTRPAPRGDSPDLPSRAGAAVADPLAARDAALRGDLRESRDAPEAIGVPQTLLGHELLPFWAAFFNTLGVPYRLSETTTRETIRRGCARCPAQPCLPVLTAYGHCADLIAAGVQRIFAPSIANLAFGTAAERLSHVCPAVQAWPYAAQAIFRDEAEFLAPRVRFAHPKALASDLVAFGRTLGFGRRDVVRAVRQGWASQARFHAAMAERGRELLGRRSDDATRLVLLARPYTICDPLVQSRLKSMFADLGVTAIPLDMIPGAPATQAALEGMYWYYGRRMMQTARVIAGRDDLAAVHLSHFGCGSDSFLVHFLRRIVPRGRLLEIELDQHSELTGVRTRLEAFLCALRDARGSAAHDRPRASRPAAPPPAAAREDRPTLFIPQMSEHAFGVAAAFRSCGIRAEVLPQPDRDSVSAGKAVVGGQECLPCAMVLGDYLQHLETSGPAGTNGDGGAALFMVSGDGPCRLGQYPYLQRLVLDARGHADVPIFDASQDPRFYDRLDGMGSTLKLRAWKGMVATDAILRCRRRFRPYTREKAAFDAAFVEGLASLSRSIEASGDLAGALRRAVHRLRGYCRDAPRRPLIALLGENYVRCNPAANGGLADRLEDRGVEVWLPGLMEWIYYTNWTARQHCLFDGDYRRYLRLLLVDRIQRGHARGLVRAAGLGQVMRGPSLRSLLRLASRYVPRSLEGEVILAVGEAIEAGRWGAAGVIHVAPFGCIGGTVFESLAERISTDLEGLPLLALYFDGRLGAELDARLDAFLMRVRARNASRPAAKG